MAKKKNRKIALETPRRAGKTMARATVKRAEKMAAARAAKAKKRRSTTVAQQSERVQRAFDLMLVSRPMGVRATLMADFDIAKSTADTIISKANTLIRAEFDKQREEAIAQVLHEVQDAIQKSEGMVRLKAIQLKIDLLGLAAPQKVEGHLHTTEIPFDPDPARMAAMEDPKLRAHILKIEEEISEHGHPSPK